MLFTDWMLKIGIFSSAQRRFSKNGTFFLDLDGAQNLSSFYPDCVDKEKLFESDIKLTPPIMSRRPGLNAGIV